MSTYRTGNHWGVTIVRESNERHADDCYCTGDYVEPVCTAMREGPPDAQLVAVVVNGDQALAERICRLLNGEATPTASRWRCNTTERCFREDGHDGQRGFAGTPARVSFNDVDITEYLADSCTCGPIADLACPVHQGRRARGPKPPNPPGCICDGSGRTCPRHGAVL